MKRLMLSAITSIGIHATLLVSLAGYTWFDLTHMPSRPERLDVVLTEPVIERQTAQASSWRAVTTLAPSYATLTSTRMQSGQRVRTISVAEHESRDKDYLTRWRDKVESLGTERYQAALTQGTLEGELRLLVSIAQDGTLLGIDIRESSGDPALDALAQNILKQAAPFEPLPPEIKADTDVLEIMRTWRFSRAKGLRSP